MTTEKTHEKYQSFPRRKGKKRDNMGANGIKISLKVKSKTSRVKKKLYYKI